MLLARRISLLALTAAVAVAPLAAHAYPGQKFVQKRLAIIRANRAAELKTKQQAALIAGNPTLVAVRDVKKLEYKASHGVMSLMPIALVSSAVLTKISHGSIEGMVVGTLAIGAELVGLGLITRNSEAKKYAHEETVKYAKDHSIALAPNGLELGVLQK